LIISFLISKDEFFLSNFRIFKMLKKTSNFSLYQIFRGYFLKS